VTNTWPNIREIPSHKYGKNFRSCIWEIVLGEVCFLGDEYGKRVKGV